jgi:DNA-directed RNA polymerase sigma subunit (sigma70/sigma32)
MGQGLPFLTSFRKAITRERVRQVESKALEKLRRAATHTGDRDALLALVA